MTEKRILGGVLVATGLLLMTLTGICVYLIAIFTYPDFLLVENWRNTAVVVFLFGLPFLLGFVISASVGFTEAGSDGIGKATLSA